MESEERLRGLQDEVLQREFEAQALREQLSAISEQIAQRTVLFSALERRWREESRGREAAESELRDEALVYRTRLQQIERQYAALERDRLEARLSLRQREEDLAKLGEELRAEHERVVLLDEELQRAVATSLGLQTTVERLRGSSLQELELEMMAEAEQLRERGRRQEEDARRQLDELRAHLAQETGRREALLGELEAARRERDRATELLLLMGGELPLVSGPTDAGGDTKNAGAGDGGSGDMGVAGRELQCLAGVVSAQVEGLAAGRRRRLDTELVVEALRSVVLSVASSITGDAAFADRVADEASRGVAAANTPSEDANRDTNADAVDEAFLLGADQPTAAKDPREEALAGDARAMADELSALRRREGLLTKALQDQGANMALVLRRAAEFESTVAGRVRASLDDELGKEIAELRRRLARAEDEKHKLEQRASAFEVEMALRDEELSRRCEAQERTERNMAVVERSHRLLAEALEADRETSRRELTHVCQRLAEIPSRPKGGWITRRRWRQVLSLRRTESIANSLNMR